MIETIYKQHKNVAHTLCVLYVYRIKHLTLACKITQNPCYSDGLKWLFVACTIRQNPCEYDGIKWLFIYVACKIRPNPCYYDGLTWLFHIYIYIYLLNAE